MRGSRHRCRACHGIYSAERNIIDASACGTSTDTTRGVCAVPRPFGLRWGVTRRQLRRIPEDGRMEWTFTGEVIEWRGPAPYLFVAMTPEDSEDLKEEARGLIYWGQVPVRVAIGDTEFTTALFPRDGRYLVPVKVAVQRAEAIAEGAVVEVILRLDTTRRE